MAPNKPRRTSSRREPEDEEKVDTKMEEKPAAAAASLQPALLPLDEPLSEEQTNVAIAALQEATGEVTAGEEDRKRKALALELPPTSPTVEDDGGSSPKRAKQRRSTPARVSWEDRIEMLRAYKDEHGDLLIPIRYKKNPSLGKFVHNTREQYKLFNKTTKEGYKKKCSLTQERIDQLNDIGFVWTTERTKRQNEDWEQRLEQLKAYKKAHGDCMVPHGYSEDPSFAEWIHRQRTTFTSHEKDGRKNKLVEERMKKLEELGFNFRVHSDKWEEHYDQLKEYKEKNGHCLVPTHYSANPKLGRWVHTQRHQRRLMNKNKKSSMTPERVAKLDDLGFSWEVRPCLERPRATWQQRYDELRDFYTDNHHFLVPAGEKPQLHSWCQEQKQRLKNLEKNGKDVSKRMGPERQKMLEELGFTKDVVLAPPGEDLGHYDHDEDDDEDHDDEEEDAKPAAQVEGEVEV